MFNHQIIDVLLVPLVGWNTKGHRLGFGGGYYDKYLLNFSGIKIGIGWESGRIEDKELNFDHWD